MPPKKVTTKEQIIEKAFQIVRKEGQEALTARRLAKELDCSTQPIYLAFSDMNELKLELLRRTLEIMMGYTVEAGDDTLPPGLLNILAYVRFAREEKFLFQLLFASGSRNSDMMQSLISRTSGMDLDMIIYANGIIMMSAYHTLDFPEEVIRTMLIEAYYRLKKE